MLVVRAPQAQAYKANVKKQPLLMLGPPILLFAVCVALGVYGVVAGAQKEASDNKSVVEGAGLDWAASFKLTLEQTFAPLTALSIFVRQNPDYTLLAPRFPSLAGQLLEQVRMHLAGARRQGGAMQRGAGRRHAVR